MKWLFGKTMLGAVLGAAVLVFQQGVSVESVTAALALLLTAAGLRHAVDRGPQQ